MAKETAKQKAEKASTAVATTTETGLTNFTQADIPKFLEQVNEKIKALTKGKVREVNIDKPLPGFGETNKLDDLQKLIEACSSVENKEKHYVLAGAKYLPQGIKAPAFKINGFSAAQWLEHLEERIIEVAHKKELDKLKQIKAKLEENLSQEAKLANDLKSISSILSED